MHRSEKRSPLPTEENGSKIIIQWFLLCLGSFRRSEGDFTFMYLNVTDARFASTHFRNAPYTCWFVQFSIWLFIIIPSFIVYVCAPMLSTTMVCLHFARYVLLLFVCCCWIYPTFMYEMSQSPSRHWTLPASILPQFVSSPSLSP